MKWKEIILGWNWNWIC